MKTKLLEYIKDVRFSKRKNTAAVFWSSIFLLIYTGLSHGLPLKCYADEWAWTEPSQAFWEGNFRPIYQNPVNWIQPGNTLIHLIWLSSYFVYAYKLLFSKDITSFSDFLAYQKGTMKEEIYLAGRFINATFAFLTLILIFQITSKLAKKLYIKKINILPYISVIFLATNGLFFLYSKHARTDIPQTFFVLLALCIIYLFLKKLPSIKIKYIVYSGIAIGLATFTKWLGLVTLCIMLPVSYATISQKKPSLGKRKKTLAKICTFLFLGILAGSLIASPTWPFYTKNIWEAITKTNETSHLGADNLSFIGNMLFYQKVLMSSFGIPLYILIIAGTLKYLILLTLQSNAKQKIYESIFYLYPYTYLVSISLLRIHQSRWLNAALPSFAIIALFSFLDVIQKLKIKRSTALGIVLMFVIITPLTKSVFYNYAFTNGDTRALALDYWNENIRWKGQKIVFDGYTPFLPGGASTICKESVDSYKEKGPLYIFISSIMYNYYYADEGYPQCKEFYNTLFTKHNPEKVFRGNPIQTDYQINFTYDLGFWKNLLNNHNDFIALPLGPDILIYSL